MAEIPGSVPLTGKVAPTDTTDTFATHVDIYGEGGYMTVANTTERDAITTERRKQGMAVFVNDTNEMYILQDGVTNADWVLFTGGGGSGDMQDVFDNSTPNVTAVDYSKELSLSAGDVNILTDTSGSGASNITLQTSDSGGGQLSELNVDPSLITLSAPKLDIEVSTSSGPDVGDVLSVNSVISSRYGRLAYKPGVQILRSQISQAQLRNLFTTPVTLINGIPSRYIMILQAYVAIYSPTVAYNTGVKLQIQDSTYGDPILETNEFLQTTVQGTRTFYPMDPSTIGPNDTPVSSSSGWKLACTADPGTSGTGSLDIFISYIVIP